MHERTIYIPYVQACQFVVSYVLVPTSSIPKAARTKHDNPLLQTAPPQASSARPHQATTKHLFAMEGTKRLQESTATNLNISWQMKKFTLSLGDLQLQTFIQDVCSIPVCPKLQARSKPNCLRHRSFKDNSGEGQEEGLAMAAVPHFNAFYSYARVVMPIIITKHWTSWWLSDWLPKHLPESSLFVLQTVCFADHQISRSRA